MAEKYSYTPKIKIIGQLPGRAMTGWPLYFSQLKSFDQLFTDAEKRQDISPNSREHFRGSRHSVKKSKRGEVVHVKEYLMPIWVKDQNTGKLSFGKAYLRPFLTNYVDQSMLSIVGDDHLRVEIIKYKDSQKALVTIQYDKIIGSRWIAYIDQSTIPEF